MSVHICGEHVASRSALLMPVRALAQKARAAGALTLIDGAHAPGQVPVDVLASGADIYVGNAHKWLLAPAQHAQTLANPQCEAT